MAGSTGWLISADLLAPVIRDPVAGYHQPLRSDVRAESFLVHHADDEASVVRDGGVDEIGGVPGGGELRLHEAVLAVGLGEAPAEPVLRCKRRVFHPDRTKDVLLRQLIEGLLHLVLRKTGGVEISLSGIVGLGAGLEVEGENVVGHATPVGKPRLVGEAQAWRKQLVPGIVLDVWINPVGIDRLVELEFPLRGHAQDRLCDDGLGERGDVVERLIVRRNARALFAGYRRPHEFAVRDIGDGDTGYVVLLEPFGKVFDDLRPEDSGCQLGVLGQERSAVRDACGEAEDDKREPAQRLQGVPFKRTGGVLEADVGYASSGVKVPKKKVSRSVVGPLCPD